MGENGVPAYPGIGLSMKDLPVKKRKVKTPQCGDPLAGTGKGARLLPADAPMT
jgi:hypothetical protein